MIFQIVNAFDKYLGVMSWGIMKERVPIMVIIGGRNKGIKPILLYPVANSAPHCINIYPRNKKAVTDLNSN